MISRRFDTRIDAAEQLTVERFNRVETMMEHVEDQRREQKRDTKAAVDAALAAQKEATGKMATSVSSQIDALRANVETEVRSIRSALADLKDRVTSIESLSQGERRQQTDQRQMSSAAVAAIGVGIAVVVAVVTVLSFFVGSM